MKKNLILITLFSMALLNCAGAGTHSNKTSDSAVQKASNTEVFTGKNSRLIGRFDLSANGQAAFTWPGSAIEFRFEGSQASIAIASQGKTRFSLSVDNQVKDFWTEAGSKTYLLASNLTKGIHVIRLTRVNESTAGVTSFTSDPQVDGKLLTIEAPKKRLLVIGDSITAGYGVEGANQSCHYTLDTSNQQLTYAALAAKNLGADLHAIAWSGIGAWRSYGEKTPVNQTILDRYPRALADEKNSLWNTAKYIPDAVLINIGTNDFWDGAVTEEYKQGMTKLIAKVQTDYVNKPIYLIVSPMLTDKKHEAQKQILNSLTSSQIKVFDLGESTGAEGFGCDYHPNTTTHARLGKELETKLKAELNW